MMKKTFIYSLVLAAFLVGCGDSAKEAANTASEKTKEATTNVIEATKEAAHSAAAGAVNAVKEGKDVAVAAKEAVSETATKAVEATKEATTHAVEATKEAASNAATAVAEKAKETVAAATGVDGAAAFKKCAACHGAKAEKKALGASQVIAGWDAAKVEEALNGYKAGTYGGNMKGVMKGQVASMSDADIKAVSTYISGLK